MLVRVKKIDGRIVEVYYTQKELRFFLMYCCKDTFGLRPVEPKDRYDSIFVTTVQNGTVVSRSHVSVSPGTTKYAIKVQYKPGSLPRLVFNGV